MGSAGRDGDRAAVYAAEDQWTATIDRGGRVDFFGSTFDLSPQLRFGSLAAMAAYVDRLVADTDSVPVVVRHRRGSTKAHYAAGVIAIPADAQWACRESVLLHEFAHHRVGVAHGHDAVFRGHMLDLVELRLGPEAALLLRTGYTEQGLAVSRDVD